MSSQLEPMVPVEDPSDDGQLTIRIPNPKVYMARQSQWIGRRGKARCDHCRSSNLKCDRVSPRCNHCSWANQRECRYTPLPTPAHRGIPRCDRCRAANMKCDRNLPICNNCEESAHGATCHYTPKKKHKSHPSEDNASGSTTLPRKSQIQDGVVQLREKTPSKVEGGGPNSHTFYGQNVATPETNPTTLSGSESMPEKEFSQTGRFTAYEHTGTGFFPRAYLSLPLYPLNTPFEFIPHSFTPEQKLTPNSSHIEPWTRASFPPLPQVVSQRLRQLNALEFPKRSDFDAELSRFQDGLINELKETMCIPAEKYIKIVNCLAKGDTSTLSKRLQAWVTMHRMCSGSRRFNIILSPRDTALRMDRATSENHRKHFVADLLNGSLADLRVSQYDTIPVMEQIYDILTYAHRSHHGVAQMLAEIINLRYAFITWTMVEIYVEMCPSCGMHRDEDRFHSSSSSSSA